MSSPSAPTLASAGAGTKACITSVRTLAVQLDSDDLYSDDRRSEDRRRLPQEKVGMVIGSYKMTNFQLQEIPPG